MIIGLDIDGVMLDFSSMLCKVINDEVGADIKPPHLHHFDVAAQLIVSKEKEQEWVDKALMRSAECRPIRGAIDGVRNLMADGHTVIYVTDRHIRWCFTTYRWLHSYGVEREIVFSSQQPPLWPIGLVLDMLVDDNPEKLVRLGGKTRQKVLFKQPHNRHSFGVLDDVSYVGSWKGLVGLVTLGEKEKADGKLSS